MFRNRRRMSQQMFADRLGKSKSWVDKVERGVRRLDKYSTIAEIALVLQVDVAELTGGREQPRRPEGGSPAVGQGEVFDIRAALERYDTLRPFSIVGDATMPLSELCKSVDHAWMTFQHANYTALAKGLPKLIVDAQLVDGTGRDAARSGAYLLAEVYQIASATLRKLGVHELAYLCADRATWVCQRAGDELLAALSTDQVAAALSALGRVKSALELCVSMAEYLAPRRDQDATPQRLSVYGMVLLQGTLAAARLGDAATMRRLLATAEEAAAKVGEGGNHYWTSFGPTNVAFYQVAAEIELGESDRALRTHSGIDPEGYRGMLPERRASHQVDVARAYLQTGNLARAGEALVAAKRLAPHELRLRPDAQEMVVELSRRTNGSTIVPGLRELADEIGFSFAAA